MEKRLSVVRSLLSVACHLPLARVGLASMRRSWNNYDLSVCAHVLSCFSTVRRRQVRVLSLCPWCSFPIRSCARCCIFAGVCHASYLSAMMRIASQAPLFLMIGDYESACTPHVVMSLLTSGIILRELVASTSPHALSLSRSLYLCSSRGLSQLCACRFISYSACVHPLPSSVIMSVSGAASCVAGVYHMFDTMVAHI